MLAIDIYRLTNWLDIYRCFSQAVLDRDYLGIIRLSTRAATTAVPGMSVRTCHHLHRDSMSECIQRTVSWRTVGMWSTCRHYTVLARTQHADRLDVVHI